MSHYQSSRRRFLKMSALLPVSAILLSPAIAQFKEITPESIMHKPDAVQPQHLRADIRSLDFDSHNFMWNFK